MATEDPLDDALAEARALRERSEREAAKRERNAAQLMTENAREQERLRQAAASFLVHARALGVPPQRVRRYTGSRKQRIGIFGHRYTERPMYTEESGWTIRPYSTRGTTKYPEPGPPEIVVREDGAVLYGGDRYDVGLDAIADRSVQPIVDEIVRSLANFLVEQETSS